jgi:hypothetical protein
MFDEVQGLTIPVLILENYGVSGNNDTLSKRIFSATGVSCSTDEERPICSVTTAQRYSAIADGRRLFEPVGRLKGDSDGTHREELAPIVKPRLDPSPSRGYHQCLGRARVHRKAASCPLVERLSESAFTQKCKGSDGLTLSPDARCSPITGDDAVYRDHRVKPRSGDSSDDLKANGDLNRLIAGGHRGTAHIGHAFGSELGSRISRPAF